MRLSDEDTPLLEDDISHPKAHLRVGRDGYSVAWAGTELFSVDFPDCAEEQEDGDNPHGI